MSDKTNPYDLNQFQKDYSVYLPSVSTFCNNTIRDRHRKGSGGFYNEHYFAFRLKEMKTNLKDPDAVTTARASIQKEIDEKVAKRLKNLQYDVDGFNFLKRENSYFNYKYALYSAGHADLTGISDPSAQRMFEMRDPDTVVVADSGGFQIGKGRGKVGFDWSDFRGQSSDTTRRIVQDWLEHTGDWSMTLDIPSWACDKENTERTGLKSFADCLDSTVHNLDFFQKNRKWKTKYLNVVSGGSAEECDIWYQAVKNYEFEGWAFAGRNMADHTIMFQRLIQMRDDNLLHNRDWIHFLGISKLTTACQLTAIQRKLRDTVNPALTISYDSASPFLSALNAGLYKPEFPSGKRWKYEVVPIYDYRTMAGSELPWGFDGPFENLTLGDFNVRDLKEPNKQGKVLKSSWDNVSYMVAMMSNVYTLVKLLQRANGVADAEWFVNPVNWDDYDPNISKKAIRNHNKKLDESIWGTEDYTNTYNSTENDRICDGVLQYRALVDKIFSSETPMDVLLDEKTQTFLKKLEVNANRTENNQILAQRLQFLKDEFDEDEVADFVDVLEDKGLDD